MDYKELRLSIDGGIYVWVAWGVGGLALGARELTLDAEGVALDAGQGSLDAEVVFLSAEHGSLSAGEHALGAGVI